ncbi:hypothetical protein ACTXT7_011924 [Hymenolepis weldensis]
MTTAMIKQLKSSNKCLGDSLTTYVKALGPRVRLIRLPQRSGLIRARLAGAKEARGSTLTFLDAHCEATKGWLEPLIAHVAQNPHSVVCPAIDVISDTSFEYLQIRYFYPIGLSFFSQQITEMQSVSHRSTRAFCQLNPLPVCNGLFTRSICTQWLTCSSAKSKVTSSDAYRCKANELNCKILAFGTPLPNMNVVKRYPIEAWKLIIQLTQLQFQRDKNN